VTDVHAFAGFLDCFDFDYFGTFTTGKPMTLSGTRIVAERLGKFVKAGKETDMFWAAEPFETGLYDMATIKHPEVIDPKTNEVEKPKLGRLGYHFHTLMNTPFHKMEIWEWYFSRYKGRANIIPNKDPAIKQAASWYLTKYITKKCSDYDFHFSEKIKNRDQLNLYI